MGFHTKTPRLQARYIINPRYTIFITSSIAIFRVKCQVYFRQKITHQQLKVVVGYFAILLLGFAWLDHFVDEAVFDRLFSAHPEVALHVGFHLIYLLAHVFSHDLREFFF